MKNISKYKFGLFLFFSLLLIAILGFGYRAASEAQDPKVLAAIQTLDFDCLMREYRATGDKKTAYRNCSVSPLPIPSSSIPLGSPHSSMQPHISPTPGTTPTFAYCDDHDPNQFHKLFNSTKNCWYDHEHGDDPTEVNDLFGSVSSWWNGSQSISYPWQTFAYDGNTSGGGNNFPTRTGLYENEAKHAGYKWYVRRDLPCTSQYTEGCVKAFRTIDHGMGHAHEAITRFHSFATEMVVCPKSRTDDCGMIRTGGWQDKGPLVIDGQFFTDYGPQGPGPRLHNQDVGNAHFGTWYGGSLIATTVQQFEDMWGLVQKDNPTELHFFCPDDNDYCGYNDSKRQIHIVGAGLRGAEVKWLRDQGNVSADGKANYRGYTDRYGTIVKNNSCSSVGIDCVPLELTNFQTGILYQFRGDAREYDQSIGELPSSPIRYPN